MKYFIIAGEASGDLHASNLMKEIAKIDLNAEFRFLGGDKMLSVGGHIVRHYRDMAFMGLFSVLKNLEKISKNFDICKKELLTWKPDVLILVDYASFNLRIAEFVKKNLPEIPVHFYISPKIWAWKEYRIKAFKSYIDKMYVILPFETEFFGKHNFPVSYVGNPCVDSVDAFLNSERPDIESFRANHNLSVKPILALLPGSRTSEINRNLPAMYRVASGFDKYQIVVSGAPGIEPDYYKKYLTSDTKIVFGETYSLLEHSHTALVTSGTATLETALFGIPQVVCFGVPYGNIPNWIFSHFMHVKYISLVNLIAGYTVVDELMGALFNEVNLTAALEPLLNESPERRAIIDGYSEMKKRLGGPGASETTARLIYDELCLRSNRDF